MRRLAVPVALLSAAALALPGAALATPHGHGVKAFTAHVKHAQRALTRLDRLAGHDDARAARALRTTLAQTRAAAHVAHVAVSRARTSSAALPAAAGMLGATGSLGHQDLGAFSDLLPGSGTGLQGMLAQAIKQISAQRQALRAMIDSLARTAPDQAQPALAQLTALFVRDDVLDLGSLTSLGGLALPADASDAIDTALAAVQAALDQGLAALNSAIGMLPPEVQAQVAPIVAQVTQLVTGVLGQVQQILGGAATGTTGVTGITGIVDDLLGGILGGGGTDPVGGLLGGGLLGGL